MSRSSQSSEKTPSYDTPQTSQAPYSPQNLTWRREVEPERIDQDNSSSSDAPDPSVRLIRDNASGEFKRPRHDDTARTKASTAPSIMSFGDPYDSPSSPSPSLPYVADSPMEFSPRVSTPSITSPPPSRPASAASSRFPSYAGTSYPPKSPRTHWAQLRRAVLPEEPPLPEEIAPGQELPRLPSPPPRPNLDDNPLLTLGEAE